MRRCQIEKKIEKNNQQIKFLEMQNRNLFLQSLELSDKSQQYKEIEKEVGRGKNKETVLMGKITWKEKYVDEDTGEVLSIERSQFVKRNGIWII